MNNLTSLARRNGHHNKVTRSIRRRTARGWRYVSSYAAGAIIGGILPAISWDVAHRQTTEFPMLWLAVAGFLAYSAPMVAQWFSRYAGQFKAWGFVVGLETAMTFTHGWTAIAALAVLIGLNAFVLAARFTQD